MAAKSKDGLRRLGAATWQGIAAIALWSSLAAITVRVGAIPPLQLAAMSFAIASVVGIVYVWASRTPWPSWNVVTASYCVLGVYGLLGYHAAYFYAVQTAPAVEANLLNYLWPLLIVVFSAALPAAHGGTRLTLRQLAGAGLGFAATILLIGGAGRIGTDVGTAPTLAPVLASDLAPVLAPDLADTGKHALGYAAAIAAAIIWASYSVASRMFAGVPVSAVTVTCALTAIGAMGLHLTFERTVWPSGPTATITWFAILAQGLGPVGLAFYLWDGGMKRGDIRLLGTLAYATPVLSTLLLTATGHGNANPTIWISVGLITAGAMLASR